MKRLTLFLFTILLCMYPVASDAASSDAADSDALFRLQLRLNDLGYLSSYPSGIYDENTVKAMDAFIAAAQSESASDAYAISAKPVHVSMPDEGAHLTGIMAQPSLRVDWIYARDMMTVGATYILTNCISGAIIHVKYLGGETYAEITPVSNWDRATLSGMFDNAFYMDKQPVTLTVGYYRIACSLKGCIRTLADGTDRYCLYFWESRSGVSGLPDCDHQKALELATRADN